MKPLPALLLTCSLVAQEAAAQARTPLQARCEDTLERAVSVVVSRQQGYRIDHTRSYHDLTRLKGGARANAWVLGLTHTESRVGIKVGGRMLSDPASGYECIAARVEVSLTYLPIVVYIGREFPAGSCAYQEVLAHEMRHLNTYLDYLPKAEARVRAALAQRFEAKPLYARLGQAQSLLQREIDSGWMAYIKSEMARVESLQAAIDSPQEYARLGKVCAGEVQSLIKQARRSKT
ncbi:hypothetical protein [Massilia sp. ST3]|uniref:hypothetical protein n=1 Tax=Massilia sp. ST3 TaxID=2824903 RepID=UPI001B822E3C|nr:hypothetical protein [Massilia sp. ST3]MBQ5948043.1 hypothetical protein [Massilia sp. ST3]